MADPAVIRLRPADAERYARLRRRMLEAEPWAFGASPEDDPALDVGYLEHLFAGESSATLAIADPHGVTTGGEEGERGGLPELVAATSIARATGWQFAHRARIWGVYVEPQWRGRGFGRAVMNAAIDAARSWRGVTYVDLAVSENSPAAHRLYESLGFEQWGREPEATAWEGRLYDEIYMTLRLV